MINFDSIKLDNINKPARYVGGEVNEVIKSSKDNLNIVLCYLNVYEKAMSNYIVNLLYNNLNNIDGVWCKRCFAPYLDFENLLRKNNINIYSLEDYKDIKENDILIFVLDNELDFANFFNILELADIDVNGKKLSGETPKIVFLPLNNVNIKPISKYADFIFNDDSEIESVKSLLNFIQQNINDYDYDNNKLIDILQLENGIVPSIKINNSSIVIDLSYISDADEIIKYINNSIKARGINKVSFRNYDAIDKYRFCEIVYKIRANISDVKIISKNIDFNKFEPEILDVLLPCMSSSTIAFNVVTCSENLINKLKMGTKKEELIDRIKRVFKNNKNSISLKFKIGLPYETYEDIDDIFNLLEEIVNIYLKDKAKDKFSMKVNIKYYIPDNSDLVKYGENSITKLEMKAKYIKEKKCNDIIKLNVDNISTYIIKNMLKNGEESLVEVIYKAYNVGARFDLDAKDMCDKILLAKGVMDSESDCN